MATKKKAKRKKKAVVKSKAKKRKALKKRTPKKKSVSKSKKSKSAKKKPAVKRIASKKTKAKAKRKKPAASSGAPRAPKPLTTPAPTAQPLPGEERVGIITHYYSHLSVAVVQVDSGLLRVGDTIHIKGHTSDFYQTVGSMEIEHVHVPEARAGQVFGLRVSEHAREHDVVYKAVTP